MSRFTVIFIVLIVALGGTFFFTKNKANAPTNSQTATKVSNHTKGEGQKKRYPR